MKNKEKRDYIEKSNICSLLSKNKKLINTVFCDFVWKLLKIYIYIIFIIKRNKKNYSKSISEYLAEYIVPVAP